MCVILAHNVRSEAEVGAVMTAAEGAGATITGPPVRTFYGGYVDCSADLDGHVCEIAHNPVMPWQRTARSESPTSASRDSLTR